MKQLWHAVLMWKGHAMANGFFGRAAAVATGALTGMASGTAAAIVRGGKVDMVKIATDAFGNAIGNAIAEQYAGTAPFATRRATAQGIHGGGIRDDSLRRDRSR